MVARLPETEREAHAPPAPPGSGKRSRRRRRLRVRKVPVSVLPTMLTLGNVLCGFAAVFFATRPASTDLPFTWTPLTVAAGLVFLGMVFDALDGRVARLTRSTSDLGANLDSMADMVTFGVAPALIAVELVGAGVPYVSEQADHLFGRAALVIAAVYVACAALRLARFGVEVSAKHAVDPNVFKGLPSPGAAGAVAALTLLHQHELMTLDDPAPLLANGARVAMLVVLLLVALAMVSKLPYIHVMNRYIRDRARFGTVAMYIIVGLLLLIVPRWSLAGGFVAYALSAPAGWAWRIAKRQTS